MFPNYPDHQFDEEFYFVSEPDRFFSFQLIQNPSLSISMIEIELQNGKEDPNSTQVTMKEVASMNEAIAFIVELVHQKTIEGYSLLDPSERSQYKELTTKKENTAEQPLEISFTSSEEAKPACDVAIKSPSSQSEYLLVADNVSRSEDKTVSDDYELIEENKDDHLEPENDPIEGCASNSSEPLVTKTFKIADLQQKDIELAINKAAEYELKYQLTSDSIQVVGKQSSLFEFLNWLYDHLKVSSNAQKQTICTKKMDISTFHRVNKEDILKKAEELNIECDFRYYMMLITGPSQSIDEFKSYLYKVEKSTKKALYPKYWDLEDTNMYSEFEVAPDSEEFKEVAPLMTDSVPRAEITKLIRIQNNYLMTLYITNINMRQEVNKEKNNRKLLFHGTKQVDPSVIYKSFDTGFDIAYAKEGGMFGKGLYFALNAAYSNAFAFPVNIKEAKYQLILADVFVGKSHNCFDSSNSIKPPEGYDSVHSRKDFYIIYNNFHSYPLYLMEYTLKKKPIPPPRPTQVHKVNFTQDNNTSTNTNMNYLTVPTLQMQPQTDLTSTNERQERLQTLKLRRREREQRAEKLMRLLSGKNKYIYNNRLSATALSRIHKDVLEIQADASLDFLFVEEPDEKNPSKYTLCLIGPSYSPYEGGLFKIQVTFPDDYPLNPPLVNFQTKIYHPCIDNEGKICLGLLDQWRPTGSLKQIGLLLSALLYDPSLEEHIMPDISAQYQTHRQSFVSQAHSWTQKYSE